MAHVPRIFIDSAPQPGDRVALDERRRHHLLRVLRRRDGDPLVLCAGDDHEYHARLVTEPSCAALVESREAVTRESPLRVCVAQGIARGDRMDTVIQKSVELGADSIQPLFTALGGVKLKGSRLQNKTQHWQAVADAAAEQSGRTRRPLVAPAASLHNWLASFSGHGFVLDPVAGQPLAPPPGRECTLLVGPEAGLSEDEIAQARARGLQAVTLGPRILRTETAALATLAALQMLAGDFSAPR